MNYEEIVELSNKCHRKTLLGPNYIVLHHEEEEMSFIIKNAMALAFKHHEGQYRKYDKVPFVQHVLRVAFKVAKHFSDDVVVAAAILHDTKEDTKITDEEILGIGARSSQVLDLVNALTNPSKGVKAPRAERKKMDRDHLVKAPTFAKVIKLADRTDNLNDMMASDRDFKILYAEESISLYKEALFGVNYTLELEFEEAINNLMSTVGDSKTWAYDNYGLQGGKFKSRPVSASGSPSES